MISRHWRATAKPENAERYIDYLKRVTFPRLKTLPGFIDATILTRAIDGTTEFLVMSRWQTVDAIKQFASDDAERAVIPAEVETLMIDYDTRAKHYAVTHQTGEG